MAREEISKKRSGAFTAAPLLGSMAFLCRCGIPRYVACAKHSRRGFACAPFARSACLFRRLMSNRGSANAGAFSPHWKRWTESSRRGRFFVALAITFYWNLRGFRARAVEVKMR